MEHIQDHPGRQLYKDNFVSIHDFKKRIVYLIFKSLDLVGNMNDIIAKHYLEMLAARYFIITITRLEIADFFQ